jgi:acyl-CoA oxidase
MAYDAAVAENIEPAIVELYLASVVKMDAAWYAENGLNRQAQRKMEDSAINAVLPHLSRYIEEMDVKPYITAPIVSDASWAAFLNGLPRFEGKGRLEAFPKDDASSLPEGPGEFGFYGGMLLSKL